MKKIFCFLVFIILLVFPQKALAEKEFATSYDVNYNVGTNGTTEVVQKVALKNLTDKYYASNFSLSIGSTTITDVTASNNSGDMETKIDNKDGKTTITVNFNQQVTGIDKSQNFILKFKSKDFTENLGKTWEVDLPRIPENANIDQYNLTLNVPVTFGDPTSIYPKPISERSGAESLSFLFSKDQLLRTGVSVNFGSNQVFDFNLKYLLENNFFAPAEGSVILPSDTNFQDVIISSINPKPEKVTKDEDGNYLAWFKVAPRSKLTIDVNGLANLYINAKAKDNHKLTSSEIKQYTKQDKYWEKDNPAIVATLKEIFKEGTPDTNKAKAEAIYQYVVKTLKYDSERVKGGDIERLGALTALNNPEKAVCMEFTDLFIALSRAANVPARELDGFAYSRNKVLRPLSFSKDLLHAWVEYYDFDKGWVMADPTWENTSGGVDFFNKFDLNHVVLAIRGVSSTMPYAVDKVEVNVTDKEFKPEPKLDITTNIPDSIWAGLPATLKLTFVNSGNAEKAPLEIKVTSKNVAVNLPSNGVLKVEALPPYGSTSYTYDLSAPFSWQEGQATILVQVQGQTIEKKITIKPVFQSVYFLGFIILGLVIIILGYGGVLAYHLYRKRA